MGAAFCYTSYMVENKCGILWSKERWSVFYALIECMDIPIGFRIYQLSIVLVLSTGILGAVMKVS